MKASSPENVWEPEAWTFSTNFLKWSKPLRIVLATINEELKGLLLQSALKGRLFALDNFHHTVYPLL
jgi:hypothetical protein